MQAIEVAEKKWFAVYTRPKFEKKVKTFLEEKNIEVFLPVQKVVTQWKDRKKKIEKVLFNSYIFVKINKSEYLSVLKTLGVVKFVSFEKKACEIPENQIDNIKRLIDNNFEIITETYQFNIGELVEISGGELKGITGKLLEYKGKKKVVISIDAINTCLLVEIDNKYLKPKI